MLTPENRWTGERALVRGIDTWSIIKHGQPRKVGQRKDRLHSICSNSEAIQWLSKMNEWDLGLLCCLSVCCCLGYRSQWPAGLLWWALLWEYQWLFLFVLVNGDTLYIRPGSQTMRPQPLPLVLLAGLSFLICEWEQWLACLIWMPSCPSEFWTLLAFRRVLCQHKRLLCGRMEEHCCCWFKIKEVNWLVQGHSL